MAEVGGAHPWGQLKLTRETCGETCRTMCDAEGEEKLRNYGRGIGRRKEEGGGEGGGEEREEGGGGEREEGGGGERE